MGWNFKSQIWYFEAKKVYEQLLFGYDVLVSKMTQYYQLECRNFIAAIFSLLKIFTKGKLVYKYSWMYSVKKHLQNGWDLNFNLQVSRLIFHLSCSKNAFTVDLEGGQIERLARRQTKKYTNWSCKVMYKLFRHSKKKTVLKLSESCLNIIWISSEFFYPNVVPLLSDFCPNLDGIVRHFNSNQLKLCLTFCLNCRNHGWKVKKLMLRFEFKHLLEFNANGFKRWVADL